jgi:hypothetical protein
VFIFQKKEEKKNQNNFVIYYNKVLIKINKNRYIITTRDLNARVDNRSVINTDLVLRLVSRFIC